MSGRFVCGKQTIDHSRISVLSRQIGLSRPNEGLDSQAFGLLDTRFSALENVRRGRRVLIRTRNGESDRRSKQIQFN